MHLYSNKLSTLATISSSNMSESFPACISCSNNFNLSQSSSNSDDKNIVFQVLEAETIQPGELNNFIGVLSRVDLSHGALTSKYISFAKSKINVLPATLARSKL